jgi:hypothetical protein
MFMNVPQQIAKHFRDVYFGGNWTCVNLKDVLADVTWQEATTKVYGLNTIAVLVNHVNYYVGLLIEVLQGKPLNGKDEHSFTHPPIQSEEDWKRMLDKVWTEAETLAGLIEQLSEGILFKDFTDSKYGNYYRNLTGNIEHTHYHLGQMVIIKKIVRETSGQ